MAGQTMTGAPHRRVGMGAINDLAEGINDARRSIWGEASTLGKVLILVVLIASGIGIPVIIIALIAQAIAE
jgi:hypothetical protein